jgi:hypothetical protein
MWKHNVNFVGILWPNWVVAVRTHMTGMNGPPLGVGNLFPLWKEGGRGPGKVEKNFSTVDPFFQSCFPLDGRPSNAGRKFFTHFGPDISAVTVTWLPSIHFSKGLSPVTWVRLLQYSSYSLYGFLQYSSDSPYGFLACGGAKAKAKAKPRVHSRA